MEHGKIKVDIAEDYPGCQHYHIIITLPGMGAGYGSTPDMEGKFVLVPLKDLLQNGEIESATFRPEYAKAIKKGLESV